MTKLRKLHFFLLKAEKALRNRGEIFYNLGNDEVASIRTRKRGKTFSYIFEAGTKNDGKRNIVEKIDFLTKKIDLRCGS